MSGVAGSAPAAFVMPHFSDSPRTARFVREAVASVQAQTDPDWVLLVVDDASPRVQDLAALHRQSLRDPRIRVLRQPRNQGQGAARNRAVREARAIGCELVLFLDCDDVAPERRLEVTRAVFAVHPDVHFLYSPFEVVDHDGRSRAPGEVTSSVAEILAQFDRPLQGPDCWYRMMADTGYMTLTSTVSARCTTMLRYPFPERFRGAEDVHCWLRIMSGEGRVHFEPSIPGRYRIASSPEGSADRGRNAGQFYRRLVQVHRQAYLHALLAALSRGTLAPTAAPVAYLAGIDRLRATVTGEGELALADELTEEIALLRSALALGGEPVDPVVPELPAAGATAADSDTPVATAAASAAPSAARRARVAP